jgi:hypothetical protein
VNMAALLHFLHLALVPVTPPSRRILNTPSWPPPRADPRYRWIEGESAGPLGRLPDRLFEHLFRRQLIAELGRDVDEPRFAGVIRLVELLAAERGVDDGASGVTAASKRVLEALFPDWPPLNARHIVPEQLHRGVEARTGRKGLLYWFEVLFARPFPVFSGRLNAWVTWWAAQWLMGPCTLEDLSPEDLAAAPSELYGGQGAQVLVHRCRFLEEAGCASVCVNACKMPTQAFFNDEMGVPMRMVPDYETLECRFKFGLPPSLEEEEEARAVACFPACPAKGALRGSPTRCAMVGSSTGLSASAPPAASTGPSSAAGGPSASASCEADDS